MRAAEGEKKTPDLIYHTHALMFSTTFSFRQDGSFQSLCRTSLVGRNVVSNVAERNGDEVRTGVTRVCLIGTDEAAVDGPTVLVVPPAATCVTRTVLRAIGDDVIAIRGRAITLGLLSPSSLWRALCVACRNVAVASCCLTSEGLRARGDGGFFTSVLLLPPVLLIWRACGADAKE